MSSSEKKITKITNYDSAETVTIEDWLRVAKPLPQYDFILIIKFG